MPKGRPRRRRRGVDLDRPDIGLRTEVAPGKSRSGNESGLGVGSRSRITAGTGAAMMGGSASGRGSRASKSNIIISGAASSGKNRAERTKQPHDNRSGKGNGKSGSSGAAEAGEKSLSNKNKSQEGDAAPLEKMTVAQLKVLLRQKGLPVSGRKAELIERLTNDYTGPKPKAWQYSDAKKDLKRALLDPSSPVHKMSMEEIRNSDDRYKRYPNFGKYFRELKKQVEAEKEQVKQDDAAAERHLQNNPRSRMNQRGYPHWDTHAAKTLLEVDVANKKHEQMKPCELRKTRGAYMEFPATVFAKRVNGEASKQKAAEFWAYKRNKRGMKKYLKEIALRAD